MARAERAQFDHRRITDRPVTHFRHRTFNRKDKGLRATTAEAIIEARNVVVATGPFQKPLIPTTITDPASLASKSAPTTLSTTNMTPTRTRT